MCQKRQLGCVKHCRIRPKTLLTPGEVICVSQAGQPVPPASDNTCSPFRLEEHPDHSHSLAQLRLSSPLTLGVWAKPGQPVYSLPLGSDYSSTDHDPSQICKPQMWYCRKPSPPRAVGMS